MASTAEEDSKPPPERQEIDFVEMFQTSSFSENANGNSSGAQPEDDVEDEENEDGTLQPAYSISDLIDGLDPDSVKGSSEDLCEDQHGEPPVNPKQEAEESSSKVVVSPDDGGESMNPEGVSSEDSTKAEEFMRSDELTVDNEVYGTYCAISELPDSAKTGDSTKCNTDSKDHTESCVLGNKSREQSPASNKSSTPERPSRLVSDISGRFHVVGAHFTDQNENLNKKNEGSSSMTLEQRRKKSMTLRRGMVNVEHIYDDVEDLDGDDSSRGERSSIALTFLENTMANILSAQNSLPGNPLLGHPGNPFILRDNPEDSRDDPATMDHIGGVFVDVCLDDAADCESDGNSDVNSSPWVHPSAFLTPVVKAFQSGIDSPRN